MTKRALASKAFVQMPAKSPRSYEIPSKDLSLLDFFL